MVIVLVFHEDRKVCGVVLACEMSFRQVIAGVGGGRGNALTNSETAQNPVWMQALAENAE